MLRVRIDYVYRLSRDGEIPAIRFGRSYRYRAESIEEWLRQSEGATVNDDK